MDWFKDYIDETVKKWLRMKKRVKINPQVEAAVSKIIGDQGENIVRDILNKKEDYVAELSLKSMSPADVWAITPNDEITHIALFQVKTTKVNTEPKELSEDEENEMIIFTNFVASEFFNSEIVPDEFKQKEYIVSSGYVGVVIDGKDYLISDAYRIGHEPSTDQLNDIPEFNDFTYRFHLLE